MVDDSSAIIKADRLSKIYSMGKVQVVALKDVSLSIPRGTFLGITGPSGSGKSTFLNLIGGLDTPTSGTIQAQGKVVSRMNNEELARYRRVDVGMIFQSFNLISSLTAVENVEVPLYPEKVSSAELRTDAISILRRLELLDREHHYPGELSGGEQQRVAIARALVKTPKVIFADEPTGNLDAETGELIMRMLKIVCRQGTTVLVASHNEELRTFADRAIQLSNGRVV